MFNFISPDPSLAECQDVLHAHINIGWVNSGAWPAWMSVAEEHGKAWAYLFESTEAHKGMVALLWMWHGSLDTCECDQVLHHTSLLLLRPQ